MAKKAEQKTEPKAEPQAEPTVPEVSIEDARRMLLQEQSAKTEACIREVDAVLKKHGCALDVSMTVTTRGVTPNIRIIPQPPRQ